MNSVNELEKKLKTLQEEKLHIKTNDEWEDNQFEINETKKELKGLKAKDYNWEGDAVVPSSNNLIFKDKATCKLFKNQWVAEIRRQNSLITDYRREDFVPYEELRRALYKRKEGLAVMALVEWLAENNNGFLYAISSANFVEEFGFTEPSYRTAMDSLIFYGIMTPTWRMARGTNGVYGRVFIFDKGFPPNKLPKEKYNPKNSEHKEKVREIKAAFEL